MTTCFVFCHGWALTPKFWEPLHEYFKDKQCVFLDQGYFGTTHIPACDDPHTQYIGIGHSLGLIQLLKLPIRFHALIGIQGFVHFLGHDSFLHAVRARELAALKKRFSRSPQETINQFYMHIGVPFAAPLLGEHVRLQEDLEFLSQSFFVPSHIPLLVLAADDDLVMPVACIKDNFFSLQNTSINMFPSGGHSLGYHHADQVYVHIMEFLQHASG